MLLESANAVFMQFIAGLAAYQLQHPEG